MLELFLGAVWTDSGVRCWLVMVGLDGRVNEFLLLVIAGFGTCLIVVLAEIFRAGGCCSVLVLKFFGSGSDTKGAVKG